MSNLHSVFESATPYDRQLAAKSFHNYNQITSAIATKFGFPSYIGAAVFSALSPNNDYLGNVRDTSTLLDAVEQGKTPEQFKVSTYGPNKIKAYRIAKGEDPLALITAHKTRNFYLNINNPDDPYPVTVDGHMYCAWTGHKQTLKGLRGLTETIYYKIADEVRTIASSNNITGCHAQGIIWFSWKRMHSNLYEFQQTFWKTDKIKAGLGFELNF